MTMEKQNAHSRHDGDPTDSSGSFTPGSVYAMLIDPFPADSEDTPVPLAPQYNLGNFVTWIKPITVGNNNYFRVFQLKGGFYYFVTYQVLVRSDTNADPGIEIIHNGSILHDSQLAAPAVFNKPVLLSSSIVIYSDNDYDTYSLALTYGGTTATSEGLNVGRALNPASLTIMVLGG